VDNVATAGGLHQIGEEKMKKYLIALAIVVGSIGYATAGVRPPAPETQRVLTLFAWVGAAEWQCGEYHIVYDHDKMTDIFHAVGLRWGDLARQVTVGDNKRVRDEPNDIVPDPELQAWFSALSNSVQDQIEVDSTEEERSHGMTHDVKGFCDKMWKTYGPGSPLQLLIHPAK
jgi:hypothetical protein